MSQLNIVEITFPSLTHIKNDEEYFKRYNASNLYLNFISEKYAINSIKFVGFNKEFNASHLHFVFSSKRNFVSKLVFLYLFISRLRGEIVFIINGFRYPHYVLFLRLHYRQPIILWHHAEQPSRSIIKNTLYKFQNAMVNKYLFNGVENAKPWIIKGILKETSILEIPEGSSQFQFYNTKTSGKPVLIWIGRLIEGKHPLLFLEALNLLAELKLTFEAHFIYQSGPLEDEILVFIEKHNMKNYLNVKKDIRHDEVEVLLNQSHYFVSCSKYEGSGYALIEALACGCIPIVSDIPAFNYLLNNLEKKYIINKLFPLDLSQQLRDVINAHTDNINYEVVRNHFDKYLSFATIAKTIEAHVELIRN